MLTEIVFVVDKSGSMSSIKNDAIGGFNSFLDEQKKVEGDARVSLVLFDTKFKPLYENVTLDRAESLTEVNYRPGGCTSLYDAMGYTMKSLKDKIKSLSDEQKPDRVIFVILTDGEENSSREYTKGMVFEKVKKLEEKKNWRFLYLGANQDAMIEGGKIGISKFNTVTYDTKNIGHAFAAASQYTKQYRNSVDTLSFNADLNTIYEEEVKKEEKKS
jgi:Mg-chelatase subunit ChlD